MLGVQGFFMGVQKGSARGGCEGLLECKKCWGCKEGREHKGGARGFGVRAGGRCKGCARGCWGAKGEVCKRLLGCEKCWRFQGLLGCKGV